MLINPAQLKRKGILQIIPTADRALKHRINNSEEAYEAQLPESSLEKISEFVEHSYTQKLSWEETPVGDPGAQ